MSRSLRIGTWVAGIVGLLLGGLWISPAFTQPEERKNMWAEVDDAMKKGLPKTAVEKLNPIIEAAKKDKAWAEAIRATGLKIALEGNVEGNKPEEKITRMQEVIKESPDEMKPVLETILAHWYWHYFQQNRWRIMERTQTSESVGDDVTTWSLRRIVDEIDARFTAALAAHEVLKKTPVAEYDALLIKGTMPDTYRPTLYDVLIHEALSFYTSGESFVTKPEDDFELLASAPALAGDQEFLQWKIEDASKSRIAKTLLLYQQLMQFHAESKDRTAYLAADLDRLRYAHSHAYGEEKDARYLAALKQFVTDHRAHETASQACHDWATLLQGQNKLVEAREIALQGKNLFPNSVGGKQCHNLIVGIEAKNYQVAVERVWNDPWPKIDINYKNLTKLHFRLVAENWTAQVQAKGRRPEWLDYNERKAFLGKQPVKTWSVDLEATPDYQSRNAAVDVPQDVKPGFYYLISSHKEDFSEADNQVHFTDVWVSKLALVIRQHNGENRFSGFVLDAKSGEPLNGATVQVWQHDGNRLVKGKSVTTDANGVFQVESANQRSHLVQVTHDGHEVVSANDYYTWNYDQKPIPDEQTVFFTDRALYRPGQTIQFKGISFLVDHEKDSYTVLKNRELKVKFFDANGEVIEELKMKTNAFGSFNGSVTAPRDRLMGQMSLQVDGEPSGAVGVRVEEYKRPKFQVKFEPPAEAPKLGLPVKLTGKATAYTGAAIDGAKVRWRVVRQVRIPYWWYWSPRGRGWSFPQGQSKEIAHGTATTGTDGSFEVTFVAEPDKSIPEDSEPTFSFSVTADVTDSAGETRSAERSVQVGYTVLQATLSAKDWLTAKEPIELTIATRSLDGEGRASKGKVKVHKLNSPATVQRPPLQQNYWRQNSGKEEDRQPDLSDPANWPLGEVVVEKPYETDDKGNAKITVELGVGAYQAVLETQDSFGKAVSARLPLKVIDPDAEKLALKVPFLLQAPEWRLEPGGKLLAVWGSGYDTARAYIEIEHRRQILKAFWTDPARTQLKIEQEITESMRGGFTVRVTMVRENRAYTTSNHVDVPWTNKQLTVKWERFVSKLKPGEEESFTAIITGPDANKAVAELVATLYDASLDQYLPHNWMRAFNVFRQDHSNLYPRFENQWKQLNHLQGNWQVNYQGVEITYRSFPMEIIGFFYGYQWLRERQRGGLPLPSELGAPPPAPTPGFVPGNFGRPMAAKAMNAAEGLQMDSLAEGEDRANRRKDGVEKQQDKQDTGGGQGPSPDNVAARKNLAETAFFFPHLVSSKEGEVRLEFKMPEALTEWKFMGFASDAELRSGFLEGTTVTAKDLMIQPNPPRYLREGDLLEFTVKVTNQSNIAQTGTVRLTFNDARTNDPVSSGLGIEAPDQAFEVPPGESKSYSWKVSVPDGMGFLTYKAVGASERLSDGEEGYLPVLPRRILVTESLPLPIRGEQTKQFEFEHLLNSGKSDTLKHQSFTVQMVSNPSWYAVMALPYLMEYPHQCNEQVFNRLYANALARHIVQSDEKIRRVFDQWRGTPALDSPLLKNEDLKSVLIEETPWLRQANAESQARRNVAILFEDNRLNEEHRRAMRQLAEAQLQDGSWSWFPGGPRNEYITLYIVTGFGRLRHLGVNVDANMAVRSVTSLDAWIDRIYKEIKNKDQNHLSSTIALYLYGRSFFLKDVPVDPAHAEAVNYFRDQAKKYWLDLGVRQSQGHLAIALNRWEDPATAKAIMASLKERSVTNEELGMFWRDTEEQWWWYRAPIETQALMIEAFEEVTHDAAVVEECKVWLIKQKQTQDWKTTKATADAIYALLLRGGLNVLASNKLVEVTLDKTTIQPEKVEAGTGFYEQKFAGGEVKPTFGKITVKKTDQGVAWGAAHWQYFEDVAKIPVHEGTPLVVRKTLWKKVHTKAGPTLEPVGEALEVGDELVVRVEIRVDRAMEYVHLKDQRGSGTEPVDVLSQYEYRDGLAYYQSTRDTASHFFIDYLPKGNYVFEYSSWVVHRGQYQSGIASIECLYAPEFNSHSNSVKLTVK